MFPLELFSVVCKASGNECAMFIHCAYNFSFPDNRERSKVVEVARSFSKPGGAMNQQRPLQLSTGPPPVQSAPPVASVQPQIQQPAVPTQPPPPAPLAATPTPPAAVPHTSTPPSAAAASDKMDAPSLSPPSQMQTQAMPAERTPRG